MHWQRRGKVINLGKFDSEEAAGRAYDRKVLQIFGRQEGAQRLNFPAEEYNGEDHEGEQLEESESTQQGESGKGIQQQESQAQANHADRASNDGRIGGENGELDKIVDAIEEQVKKMNAALVEERSRRSSIGDDRHEGHASPMKPVGREANQEGPVSEGRFQPKEDLPAPSDPFAGSQSAEVPPDAKAKGKQKGSQRKWYELPAPELTPEVKNDLRVLQLRGVLNPKRFYKRPDNKRFPDRFQIGEVIEHSQDFYSSRIPRRERAASITKEALADPESSQYRKRKFHQLQNEQAKVLVPPKKRGRSGKGRPGRSKL